MKKPFTDFYSAFWWLERHPAMWYRGEITVSSAKLGVYESAFPNNVEVYAAKVHPRTKRVSDDDDKNTRVRIWLEVATFTKYDKECFGPIDKFEGLSRHDYVLDCGGDTYEEAIIALAEKVWKVYGLYGRPQPGVWGSKSKRVMRVPKWLPKYARPEHTND